MANSPQARKRARQNQARRLTNASQKSAMRTVVKNFKNLVAIAKKNQSSVESSEFTKPQSALSKAASKKLIHKKTGQRLLKRLHKMAKATANS